MFLLSRELTSGEELRLEHGRKGSSPANLTPAKGLIPLIHGLKQRFRH